MADPNELDTEENLHSREWRLVIKTSVVETINGDWFIESGELDFTI